MCKSYGGEPEVELFRGFFNLYPCGQWLNFSKRQEKDVPNVLPKVITRIEDWKCRLFYVQDFIIPKMAFRNFMYAKYDEDLFFLPCEPSLGFGTSSTSASINNEPPLLEADPLDSANTKQLVKNTADSGGSPAHEEMLVIGTSSVVGRMKDRKCRTKGFTKPPVKHKLVHAGSSLRSTHQKSSPAKADSS
nr:hypothetical protein [Tanacetum cinerariifolium]